MYGINHSSQVELANIGSKQSLGEEVFVKDDIPGPYSSLIADSSTRKHVDGQNDLGPFKDA